MKEALLNIIGNKFILYGLIAVVVVFIIIVIIMSSKNGNNLEKAQGLHKKAEDFHILGKDKKSEELNEKAKEIRKEVGE